jgi:plasmid stability protein
MPKRHNRGMNDSKRATVYFDSDVHRALRLKAAATDRSISDVVNEAVKSMLAEDAEDLAALDQRKGEQVVTFKSVVRGRQQRGRI